MTVTQNGSHQVVPRTPSGGPVRVLHLEDSVPDAELIAALLAEANLNCAITLTSNEESFKAALSEQAFDLILCDHGLPGYNGFAALRLARTLQPDAPVIMISGLLDDAQAVESLKGGATDYVLKGRLARLVPAVRRALKEAEDQRKQAANERRLREHARLLELTRDAIVVRSIDDNITFWNSGR